MSGTSTSYYEREIESLIATIRAALPGAFAREHFDDLNKKVREVNSHVPSPDRRVRL